MVNTVQHGFLRDASGALIVSGAGGGAGQRLATFGHSYNDPNFPVGVVKRQDLYGARLAALLGMVEDNYHVAGTYVLQGTGNAYDRAVVQLPALPTAPPLRALVNCAALYVGHNDIAPALQPSIATEPTILVDFLRAIICRLRAGQAAHVGGAPMVLAQGTGATSWTTTSSASWFGGSLRFATDNGNTWTLTLPATFPGGQLEIWGMRNSATGAVHTITLDGVAQAPWDTRGATTTTNRPTFYRFTGLSAGSHVIVGTITNLVGGVEHLNYWQIPHLDPPPVAYANVARTPAAANGQTDTVVNTFIPLLAAIETEFSDGRVVCIEADAVFNKAADMFGDGTHPSPKGAAAIAKAFYDELSPLISVRDKATQAFDQNLAPTYQRSLVMDETPAADARSGQVTLVAGAATITTRAIQSNARIFLQPVGTLATMGQVVEISRTNTNNAVSGNIVINSKDSAGATVAGDTRVVHWFIVQPN